MEQLLKILIKYSALTVGDGRPLRMPCNQLFTKRCQIHDMCRVVFNWIRILSAFCNEVSVSKVLFIRLLHRQNIFVIAPKVTSFYCTLRVSACADFICTFCICDLIEAKHYISVTDISDGFTAIEDRAQGLAAIHHIQFLYTHDSVNNFDRRANCRSNKLFLC